MSCYQLKGGIGSSSRVITLDNKEYTVGRDNHKRDSILNYL